MASQVHFEDLPDRFLHRLCEFLVGQHYSDLGAFSLASRKCHAVAAVRLYHTIRLEAPAPTEADYPESQELMKDPVELAAVVRKWTALLQRHNAFKYVECLKVIEPGPIPDDPLPCCIPQFECLHADDNFKERLVRGATVAAFLAHADTDSDDNDDDDDDDYESGDGEAEHADEERDNETCPSWNVLARLMERLTHLQDFHFDCCRPLPKCILRVIDQHQAHCSLHLDTFFFKGYVLQADADVQRWPVLQSSRLRTVRNCSGGNGCGREEYSHEAICKLLDGGNSAIEHVSLLTEARNEGVLKYFGDLRGTRPTSPFIKAYSTGSLVNTTDRAILRSFEFGGDIPAYTETLMIWYELCNTSELRHMKLLLDYRHLGFGWLASSARFNSLTSLVIGSRISGSIRTRDIGNVNLVLAFLNSLPPLKEIRFIADINEAIFTAVLFRHGRSLRRLWFARPYPVSFFTDAIWYYSKIFFTPVKVAGLTSCCPMLEDLTLTIPRLKGSAAEIEMYKSLGSLPRLQTLSLYLDCDDTSLDLYTPGTGLAPNNASFDEYEQQGIEIDWGEKSFAPSYARKVRKGHVRDSMINAAFDVNLARQIFLVISAAKPRSDSTLSLQRLELRPIRGIYPRIDSEDVVREIAHWWLLERNHRDDQQHIIMASRLQSIGDTYAGVNGLEEVIRGDSLDIFRRLWPKKLDGVERHWSEEWSSFPLEV